MFEFVPYLIIFGLPLMTFFYPQFPRWPRSFSARFVGSVLSVWLLLLIYDQILWNIEQSQAIESGEDLNDGIDGLSGTALLLMFGWILGVIGCIPALILVTVWNPLARKARIHRTPLKFGSADQAGADENATDPESKTESVLKFGCGGLAGLFAGCVLALCLLPNPFSSLGGGIVVVAAFACAALSLRFGDRFWNHFVEWFTTP